MNNSAVQPLYPLIIQGIQNNIFPNNFSSNFNLINTSSNVNYTINRDADAIIIDGLIIPKTVNLDKIKNIQLQIGGMIIFNLPFDIIDKKNIKVSNNNNNYIISIPKELLVFESSNEYFKNNFIIPLVSLASHIVQFNINSDEHFDYKIITKNVYYDTNIRQSMITNPQYIDVYGYEEFQINSDMTTIHPNLISTGMYIKLNDILSNYKLYKNGMNTNEITEEIIEFYNFLIKKDGWTDKHSLALYSSLNNYLPPEMILHIESFIDKNNTYLYYIPFNLVNNNIEGTINFGMVDNIRVKIETCNKKYNGKFYVKNINRLQICDGMAGLKYS